MPKFVLAYHGGKSSMSKEEGQEHMKKWKSWMDGMGDAVVNRGWPVGKSKTIGSDGRVSDGGGPNPLSGVSVIEADDFEAALEMAKKSPHLDIGGSMEVAEAMDMEM